MPYYFREDIQTIITKDPAAHGRVEALSYPGLWAIWYHRVAHAFWVKGYKTLARYLSQFSRFWTGIEIHPGAKIGRRLFIDHGMGLVIGETAEIGDDVLLYHGVTLGGTGNEQDRKLPRRHPKLGDRVIVGTGTAIIGGVEIGDDVTIGASSLVRQNIPNGATVVGNPGRVVKIHGQSVAMEKIIDPREETIARLVHDVNMLMTERGKNTPSPTPDDNIPEYEI
jgi:serine O-acetyltransferase